MADDTKENSMTHLWWLAAAALLSFTIGVVFFLTIAQTKSGDPIPVDAAPHYYMHDAG